MCKFIAIVLIAIFIPFEACNNIKHKSIESWVKYGIKNISTYQKAVDYILVKYSDTISSNLYTQINFDLGDLCIDQCFKNKRCKTIIDQDVNKIVKDLDVHDISVYIENGDASIAFFQLEQSQTIEFTYFKTKEINSKNYYSNTVDLHYISPNWYIFIDKSTP